jgi:hypothetical protein
MRDGDKILDMVTENVNTEEPLLADTRIPLYRHQSSVPNNGDALDLVYWPTSGMKLRKSQKNFVENYLLNHSKLQNNVSMPLNCIK